MDLTCRGVKARQCSQVATTKSQHLELLEFISVAHNEFLHCDFVVTMVAPLQRLSQQIGRKVRESVNNSAYYT